MNPLKTRLLILIGAVCAVTWGVMAFQDASLRPDLLVYVKATLAGIVALVLRDMPNPSDPVKPPNAPTSPMPGPTP